MADNEVVVGATKKNLVVTLEDENGDPINLTGGSVKLQGKSADIATEIDVAGTLTDPANGVATFAQIGALVTHANLGTHSSATYKLRVKFTDSSTLFDYGPEFTLIWVDVPITPAP